MKEETSHGTKFLFSRLAAKTVFHVGVSFFQKPIMMGAETAPGLRLRARVPTAGALGTKLLSCRRNLAAFISPMSIIATIAGALTG